jgi:hypothetical protein
MKGETYFTTASFGLGFGPLAYRKNRLKTHGFNRRMVARHPLLGMVRATNLLYIERMSGAHPTGSGDIPRYVMVRGSSGEPISPTG